MTTPSPPCYLGQPADHWARLLSSPDPLQRRLAAHALGMIGPEGRQVGEPALVAALGDPESFVRVWAAAALARVDPDHPAARDALVAAMRDDLAFVRSLGAWFVGRLGPRLADARPFLPDLRRLADDEDPSVRTEAELALKILQPRSIRARA